MRRSSNFPPVGGFTLNQDSPLAKGLVFWLPLIDRNLNDRARGLNFTLSATTPTPATIGDIGNCWSFVLASSTYMVSTATPVTVVPCTIACWFYPTQVGNTKTLVSLANSSNTTDFFQLQHVGSSGGARARQGDATSTSNASSTNGTTVNTWHHACGVFKTSTSRSAYLNGTGKATSTSGRTPSGCDRVGIGATLSSTPTDFYGGSIAHICVWNRALDDAEVWSLWQPSTRWDLYAPAAWNGAVAYPFVISRPNAKPVSRAGVPIHYLRI